MRVTVHLHANLRKYAPPGSTGAVQVDLPEGAAVHDAVSHLGIPERHAGVVFLGQERAEFAAKLVDGAEVNLFPPLGGG